MTRLTTSSPQLLLALLVHGGTDVRNGKQGKRGQNEHEQKHAKNTGKHENLLALRFVQRTYYKAFLFLLGHYWDSIGIC